MTLDEWLTTNGMNATQFGELTGLPKQSVYNYRRNKRFPSREALRIIAKATGGKVTANDFADAPLSSVPSGASASSGTGTRANLGTTEAA